jgi:hypothetical protein
MKIAWYPTAQKVAPPDFVVYRPPESAGGHILERETPTLDEVHRLNEQDCDKPGFYYLYEDQVQKLTLTPGDYILKYDPTNCLVMIDQYYADNYCDRKTESKGQLDWWYIRVFMAMEINFRGLLEVTIDEQK